MAHHVQADFLGLGLERIRHADAIGAGVVENVNRLHLQGVTHVVGHVRTLIGIRRDRAEIDRLAARLVLAGEFRIGDVRIGRGGRDGREIGGRQDRCHRLALAAHLRPDDGDHARIRHELLRVRGGLSRIVLAGRRRAAVKHADVEFVAAGTVFGVHGVDSHQGAVFDARCRIGISARQRQFDPDGDGLILRLSRRKAGQGGKCSEGDCAPCRRH